jgi:transposase-like protein
VSRRGRELTPELVDRMAELRGWGWSIAKTCKEVGISTSTFYRWVREAQAFAVLDRMKEAGLSFEEILAVVESLEREGESRR